MIIQRNYRGHFARLSIPKLWEDKRREQLLNAYLKSREDQTNKKILRSNSERLKAAYIKERGEERTARFTGRIAPVSEYGGDKMR